MRKKGLMYLLDLQFFGGNGKKTESDDDYDYGDPIEPEDDESEDDSIDEEDTEIDDESEDNDYVETEDEETEDKPDTQKVEETKSETKSEDENKTVEKPKTQSRDVNHEMAEQRRKKAEEEARKKAEKEQYLTGFKAALGGKNPFTSEVIETEDDVLECQLMLKAKEKGLDPILDYHKMVKEYRKEESEKAEKAKQEQTAKEDFVKKDIAAFKEANPDVDLSTLFNDNEFKDFASDLTGSVPLATIYKKFLASQSKVEKAKNEASTMREARKESSPGNLNSGGTNNANMFTVEQLKKMTPAQIKEHWKEISKSYK